MDVAGGAVGVREVLLGDEDERTLRHSPPVDLALGGDDLLEWAAGMDGPGPAACLVRPRHATLDREVDLERARATAVAPVRPLDAPRKSVPGQVRDSRRREVVHDGILLLDL